MDTMTVTITDGQLNAEISSRGAELIRLWDSIGRDLLWNGDARFWTGRAPLLFPIVGSVKDDQIEVAGNRYPLPRHGFARNSAFELLDASSSRCSWRLASSAATRVQYPFEFTLDVSYEIEDGRLEIRADVSNRSDRTMPVSFGFHPALRWPLPYGGARDAHQVRFDREEPFGIRRLKGGLLDPVEQPTPVRGKVLALRDELFEDDVVIFDRLQSQGLEYEGPASPPIRIDFAGMPHLGLWSKPGAGFLCIEPWQGFASPVSFAGDLADKPGGVAIQAGASRMFKMGIAAPSS
jgi:galactose mutarotase-like enzyme